MDHTIVFHTISLAKKVRRTIEAQLNIPFSYSQASALLTIASQSGVSQVEIANRLHMEPATIVSLIDELERSKLVTRNEAQDRRKYNLILTEKGKEAVKQIKTQTKILENRLRANLSQAQIDDYLKSLETISTVLDTFNNKKGGEK